MTDKAQAEAAESDSGDTLTAEEEKYFDSKGGEPEAGKQQPPQEEEKKDETKDDADESAKASEEAKDDEEDGEEEPLKEGDKGNQGRFVRHGAFHQEREKRKALEKELTEYRDRQTRLDERLRIINEAMVKPKTEEQVEEMPDPEKDVFGALNYALNKIKALEGGVAETRKTSEQSAQQNEVLNTYRADAASFAKANPDFGNAYQYAMETRDKELEALGYSDPVVRANLISQEEQWIVTEALKAKQSPSARIYNFAKVKGYKQPEPKKEEQKANNDAEKLEKIQKGQEASKTLSGVGGAAGGELTASALADMSEEEFDAWMAKTSPAAQRRIFGG